MRAVKTILAFVRLTVTHLVTTLWSTLVQCVRFIESWLLDTRKARYGIAVTRMLLGLSAFGLLLSNFTTRLYSFGSGSVWNGEAEEPKSDFPKIWLFSLFHRVRGDDALFTTLYIVLMVLALLVVIGIWTRIIVPVFFVGWVSFIEMNDMLGDQGDNMFRIAILIMLFVDTSSRWSFDAARRRRRGEPHTDSGEPSAAEQIRNLLHNLGLVALTAQVSFVYMSGALYKAGGTPWSTGYAVYNPLQTERFGTWPVLSDLFTAWGPMVVAASWGSIILQMTFPFLLLRRPTRIIALLGILGFHIGIAVLMGLPWFSLTMVAIDAIFIRDRTWAAMVRRVKHLARDARATTLGVHT